MPLYQVVLFAAAMAVVFTQGTIFKPLRRGPWIWRELASCALCSGVWLGAGMYCLFYGFPHVGGDLWTIVASAARVLGAGSVSGCVAVLFVAVWERLDERPVAAVQIENATLAVRNPTISAARIRIVNQVGFGEEEAPTDPTNDNKLTKKVSTDRLPIAASRRSDPDEKK